jgi:uncharacterized heparinase superfamily protein
VLADAGPHGFLSIAAHAHADALAFTLSVGGQPILVDAGTFDYFGADDCRAYFRSTRAHNTVLVDDLDQSVPAGPFLWTRHARTKVEARDETMLTASHDGYRRLGVIHRRQLELRGSVLRVEDTLTGTGTHEITLCFHAAPECRVERVEPNVLLLSRPRVRVRMRLPDAMETDLMQGAEKGGWYSAGFGVKKEAVSVFARLSGRLPVSLTTVLEIEYED